MARPFRPIPAQQGAKTCFGVELGDADGGEFFHQLVHADVAMLRQLAESGMFVIGRRMVSVLMAVCLGIGGEIGC